MNKNNKRQRLQLTKETVVHLSKEMLLHVVGGDDPAPPSIPISSCPTGFCAPVK